MAQKRKSPKKKPAAKRSQRKKPAKQKIQPVEEILFRVEGKMSTFGGPTDTGMSADEGLALFNQADLQDPKYSYLFLPTPPPAAVAPTKDATCSDARAGSTSRVSRPC